MSGHVARVYLIAWSIACVAAGLLLLRERKRIELCSRSYWLYLARTWKLVTFALAAAGLTLLARYADDPTWDSVDAVFMSALAFATAPWTIGTFFKIIQHRCDGSRAFIATVVWLFSASWSYDLYLLIRDGSYPVTWWANLFASSLLYLAAGLFWNLDWTDRRGWVFGFTEEGWPTSRSGGSFRRVLLPALVLMGVIGVAVLLLAWPVGRWR